MATPTSLPASFVSGAVLTAAQMNNLRGAFRILQVVDGTTTTPTSTTSATYATTSLSATITPQATSSKIGVLVSLSLWNPTANTEGRCRVVRGATDIYDQFPSTSSAANNLASSWVVTHVDSPATTSATTYTVQFARQAGAGTLTAQVNNSRSSIILLEISA